MAPSNKFYMQLAPLVIIFWLRPWAGANWKPTRRFHIIP